MTRMSPDERREAIIAATLVVMRRQGMAATTVRDVAAELGTSSGLIHHYVDSMDVLLAEAFGRAAAADLEMTRMAVTAGDSPTAQLARFFDTYARADSDAGMQLWLDAWAEASRRPALQRISRAVNEEWQTLLADILVSGAEHGAWQCPRPDRTAWVLLSLLDGLTLQAVAHGGVVSLADAVTWSRRAAEAELGLLPGALG